MSNQALNWAFEQDVQPSAAKFVLVCLADHADKDAYCFPAQEKLAKHTGQSERSVRAHLVTLEAAGLIQRVQRRDARGHRMSDGFWLVGFKSLPAESAGREVVDETETLPADVATREPVLPADSAAWDESLPANLANPTGKSRQTLPADFAGIYKGEPPVVEPSVNPQTAAAAREADESTVFVTDTVEILGLAPWMTAPLVDVTAAVPKAFRLVPAFDPRDGPLEAEKFTLYHAKKPPKSWYSAWLNWLKQAVRYEQEQQSRTNANPDRPRPHGEPARTGRTSAGSAAGATGVDAGIAERGYSYDEIARRRAEASRARQDRSTAAGGGAGT